MVCCVVGEDKNFIERSTKQSNNMKISNDTNWYKDVTKDAFDNMFPSFDDKAAALTQLVIGKHATKRHALQYVDSIRNIIERTGINGRHIEKARELYFQHVDTPNNTEIDCMDSSKQTTSETVTTYTRSLGDTNEKLTTDTSAYSYTAPTNNKWHRVTVNSESYSVLCHYSRTLNISINEVISSMIHDLKMIDQMNPKIIDLYLKETQQILQDEMDIQDSDSDTTLNDTDHEDIDRFHHIIGTNNLIDDVIAVERTASAMQKLQDIMADMTRSVTKRRGRSIHI